MRYIIHWGRKADKESPAHLTTFTAEEAETLDAARSQFLARHPDYYIEAIKPAGPGSFEAYGMGAWTEEEQEQHREKLRKMYADQRTERGEIRERLLTYTPEEFAAEAAYMLSREEPTQNAEGVHVGDILYSSWGWEQTNIDFYQVVGLRGKHTLILRELAAASGEDSHMTGLKRPRRDVFRNDKQYTVRSKFTDFSPDVPYILDPTLSTGVTLHPVEFGKLYDFSTYA